MTDQSVFHKTALEQAKVKEHRIAHKNMLVRNGCNPKKQMNLNSPK
jgi:hypothetical protein